MQQRKEPRNQKLNWTNLTMDEFKTWLGLYLSMGIVNQPSLRDYWDQSSLTRNPVIAEVTIRDRNAKSEKEMLNERHQKKSIKKKNMG